MGTAAISPWTDTRTHNSARDIPSLVDAPQVPHARKPRGLWYAFGSGWRDFVSKASPDRARALGLGRKGLGTYDFEVVPGDKCRVLRLDTWDAILAFTVEYGQNVAHAANGFWWQKGNTGIYDPTQDPDMPHGCRVACIDWPRVAHRYDGIEVTDLGGLSAPRPRVEWLDIDWGVSSGCIWNVRDVTLRPVAPKSNTACVEEAMEAENQFQGMRM